MPSLVLVRGTRGSGKTTFASEVMKGHVQIEADMYFYDDENNYNFNIDDLPAAYDWCINETVRLMKEGVDIAVTNTFTQEYDMKQYINWAHRYGYTLFTVVMENRHNGKSVHNIPQVTIYRQEKRLRKSLVLIAKENKEVHNV